MTTTRLVLVEIQGEDKDRVDRFANLLQDQVNLQATFIQGAMEDFAEPAPDQRRPVAPSFKVTNTLMEGVA